MSSGHGAAASHGSSRKKHHGHEEHEEHVNHEAWVIPYADLLTLLLAMFLALWAAGKADVEKLSTLAGAFRSQQGISITDGGAGVLPGQNQSPLSGSDPVIPPIAPITPTTTPVAPPGTAPLNPGRDWIEQAQDALNEQQARQALIAAENDLLDGVEQQIRAAAESSGIEESLTFRREARGLVVAIVSDRVLFDSGEAALLPVGLQIVDGIVDALKQADRPISIEGHTDSRPVGGRYASNWELSTARATTVLRYLVEQRGFASEMVSASGYGETKPIATNDTSQGQSRNRRVEIVVLSAAANTP